MDVLLSLRRAGGHKFDRFEKRSCRTVRGSRSSDSTLARAVGRDDKGWLSMILYAVAIPLAFRWPSIAVAIYVAVAVMWFIPDRRIEKVVGNDGE
jgi:hypothetical protein